MTYAIGLIDTLLTLIFTALLPPFFFIVIFVVCLASLGKTIGIRQKYVQILLKIFEFGKQRLAKTRKRCISTSTDVEDDEVDDGDTKIEDIVFQRRNKGDSCREPHEFQLSDSFEYIAKGMEAIVDDEVTKRFAAEELTSWNFLTRTNLDYEFISVRLTVFWFVGFVVRYCFLLPLRICILLIGMGILVLCTYVVGCLPNSSYKKSLNKRLSMFCFDFLSGCLSLVCQYHNGDNVPQQGICVANHTSPMDVLVLACDNTYDMVGQRHGGFLGIFQRALSRASDHIWFERSEAKDRFAVARRLRNHVEDPDKMPILIFPEGTCINNTSVMQFKKGTFEVGGVIYPVAIKYDARFGDAFWNSSKFSMMSYIYMMMTSWAIVCDVWYLPPMTKRATESSIEFANRVKAEIAKQGGLVDLLWDGALKRSAPKKELKEQFQHDFSRRLILRRDSQRRMNPPKQQTTMITTSANHIPQTNRNHYDQISQQKDEISQQKGKISPRERKISPQENKISRVNGIDDVDLPKKLANLNNHEDNHGNNHEDNHENNHENNHEDNHDEYVTPINHDDINHIEIILNHKNANSIQDIKNIKEPLIMSENIKNNTKTNHINNSNDSSYTSISSDPKKEN